MMNYTVWKDYGTTGANTVWRIWVNTSSETCGSTLTIQSDAWSQWCGSTGRVTNNMLTLATTQGTAWTMWQNMPHSRIEHVRTYPQRTAEEIERDRQHALESIQRAKSEAEARKVITARARKLLIECLTDEQRATYQREGYFDVLCQGRTFRIKHGTHGNIAELDRNGKAIARYCVQPNGVPTEDAMLSQKLALELAPAEFFAKANVTRFN